ncbi:PIN-like domain-containing protein [Salinibacter altiplanensis]|uniref:PIN-like domain-containing protein n=1 Tax=Salinibacter altiplanensis TaxID=1803181 RepID=UPI00131A5033|nr:PIN-like domain-containing protein [Salinibacter altiplanensis]
MQDSSSDASIPAGSGPEAATSGGSDEHPKGKTSGQSRAPTGTDDPEAPASPRAFAYEERFPDAQSAFGLDLSPPQMEAASTLVVLDTSALLLLYDATEAAARAALQTFDQLREEDRLVVPGHAAREYAVVRSYKITDLYDDLSRQTRPPVVPNASDEFANRALVESLGYADRLDELREQIAKLTEAYHHTARTLMEDLESWAGDDFISEAYAELFGEAVVHDLDATFEDTRAEVRRRDDISRPPGYLDSGKDQNAAGDLLIWKTLLEVASRRDRDALLVTQDCKSDWWHQGGRGTALYPRTELIHEFDRETGGRSFGLLTVPGLLRKMEVKPPYVRRFQEAVGQAPPTETIELVGAADRVQTVATVATSVHGATVTSGGRLGTRRAVSLRVREGDADAVGQLARDAGLEVTRAADGRVAQAFERHEKEASGEESADDGPAQ